MAASGSGPAARPGSDCIPGLPHRLVLDMVEMGFEKFVRDEIVDSDTFFTREYRERHRDKVEAFFELAWATHAKLPEFIHLCIARHNFEGTHRLGDVRAPTLVLIGEADTVGSNHIAQSNVLLERIPGAEMKILKGQSHGFFWQAPEETNAVILDWVKDAQRELGRLRERLAQEPRLQRLVVFRGLRRFHAVAHFLFPKNPISLAARRCAEDRPSPRA